MSLCPSPLEAVVLRLLLSGPSYSFEMVKASKGKLVLGSIYVTMMRMEKKGYLFSFLEPRENGSPIRMYVLTPKGRELYKLYQQMVAVMEKA